MVEKLKSILKQIHWSLLLKAAIFALAWAFFPFWLFVLVALYLYFIPLFQARPLIAPFLVLLILAFIQSPSLIFAVIFGAIFYYLLLIKDLILIDRRSAHELLVVALSFFLLRDLYQKFGSNFSGAALWYAFLTAVVFGILVVGFLRSFTAEPALERQKTRRIIGWLSFLVAWQFLVLGLILPLDFIYQSIIVFVALVLVLDLGSEHYFGIISRQKLVTVATTVFTLLAIILASAKWGI